MFDFYFFSLQCVIHSLCRPDFSRSLRFSHFHLSFYSGCTRKKFSSHLLRFIVSRTFASYLKHFWPHPIFSLVISPFATIFRLTSEKSKQCHIDEISNGEKPDFRTQTKKALFSRDPHCIMFSCYSTRKMITKSETDFCKEKL